MHYNSLEKSGILIEARAISSGSMDNFVKKNSLLDLPIFITIIRSKVQYREFAGYRLLILLKIKVVNYCFNIYNNIIM